MIVRPVLGTVLLWLAACSGRGDMGAVRTGHAAGVDTGARTMPTAARPDRDVIRAAELALTQWLAASRESTADSNGVQPPSIQMCDDDGGATFPSTLLADFTLLPSEFRGDTIVGRADVTTVAEQDIDRRASGRFVARQRVAHAVLEWDVVQTDDGDWAVCNGLRFGYRGSDSLTAWRPDGSSYRSARRLADSIVAARQRAPSSSSRP